MSYVPAYTGICRSYSKSLVIFTWCQHTVERVFMYACVRADVRTCVRAYVHACVRAYALACVRPCT